MRVFVVEDVPKMAAFLVKGLRKHGLAAKACHRGAEVLERILTAGFDAVVPHIMLPVLDGLALTRRLHQKGNPTPVLMLSALGEVDDRVEGIEAGADDYLSKPFAAQDVLARANACVKTPFGTLPVLVS